MPEVKRSKFDWKKIEPKVGSLRVEFKLNKDGKAFLEGDSQYGHWTNYPILVNGQEEGWFVSEDIHALFQTIGIRRGDVIMISTDIELQEDDYGNETWKPYAILDFKGKKYEIGKKNGTMQAVQSQPTAQTEQPKEENVIPIREQKERELERMYKETVEYMMNMLGEKYHTGDELTDKTRAEIFRFGESDVVRMINTLFMAKAKLL